MRLRVQDKHSRKRGGAGWRCLGQKTRLKRLSRTRSRFADYTATVLDGGLGTIRTDVSRVVNGGTLRSHQSDGRAD